ncbi:MAG: hypothetical protein NW208_01315 [Bryobacter sp.]|nr:hypothetical protein [Bryobacter sp.]
MLEERRPLVRGRLKYLVLVPGGMALVAIAALAGNTNDLVAGAPVLLLLFYGALVLCWGEECLHADGEGFSLRSGFLWTGIAPVKAAKADVIAIFPLHLREVQARYDVRDHFYAAVELAGERWVNLRGPFPNWQEAQAAAATLARLWERGEVGAGRHGFPPGGAWQRSRPVLLWGGGLVAALVWAGAKEILR